MILVLLIGALFLYMSPELIGIKQTFTIQVIGTPGLKFKGSYMTVSASGESVSQSVEGEIPKTYYIDAQSVSCTFQNQADEGTIALRVFKNGKTLLSSPETSAAYGIVSAAH